MRLFGAIFFALALFVAFSIAQPASAADNSVSLDPQASFVQQGSTTGVGIVVDPPASGVSIWIIRVDFDPTVAEFVGCTVAPGPPPPIAFAAGCDISPSGDFVTFGGWVENQGGVPHGFETIQTLATVMFKGIGPVGSQTVLDVRTGTMLGPLGQSLHPTDIDGLFLVTTPPFNPVGGSVELISAPESGGVSMPAIAVAVLVAVAAATSFAWRWARRG